MKVTVSYASEYVGMEQLPKESFDLVVESDDLDRPEDVAKTYLKLRKILWEGIKKEEE